MFLLSNIKKVEKHAESCPCCGLKSRRDFIVRSALVTSGLILGPQLAQAANKKDRLIMMTNPHTGEKLRTLYWTPVDGYISESMQSISHFMRDFRLNKVKAIDPALIDILHAILLNVGPTKKVELMSGYRSPKTNKMLARRSRNVAKKSMHMVGQAMDFQVNGCTATSLRKIALALNAGGVGFYPGSNFIHVDSGDVRSWVYS